MGLKWVLNGEPPNTVRAETYVVPLYQKLTSFWLYGGQVGPNGVPVDLDQCKMTPGHGVPLESCFSGLFNGVFLGLQLPVWTEPWPEDLNRLDSRPEGRKTRPFRSTLGRLQVPVLVYNSKLRESGYTVVKIRSRRTTMVYGTWGQFPTQKKLH